MEWKAVQEKESAAGDAESDFDDEDMMIQLARSNFGDMIYDYDRNNRFSEGLKHHIEKMKAQGRDIHVIDIGTGTSLLSLMAARHGADRITALEVFDPMAAVAEKIIAKNGYSDRIKVIHSRSTEVDRRLVNRSGDIIVAEVFDTELIGEGALSSFKKGLQTLAKEGCRVVPATARVWVAPVSSKAFQKFRRMPSGHFVAPFADCPGVSAVFDIQLSEVDPTWWTVLADPVVAFEFNFEDADAIIYDETFFRSFQVTKTSTPQDFDTLLFWWDLDMSGQGYGKLPGTGPCVISTVPRQFGRHAPWRDHWMPAVYYLPEAVTVSPGDMIDLQCSHDEYSVWFAASKASDPDEKKLPQPAAICSCQLHVILSRYDFYRMHSLDENAGFVEMIQKLAKDKLIIAVGDASLVSLYASKTAKSVIALDTGNGASARMLKAYAEYNSIENLTIVSSANDAASAISADKQLEITVIAEPYFSTVIMPWHAVLRYRVLLQQLIGCVETALPISIAPKMAKLRCIPVEFDHLWKIAAPVGTVDGFDLSHFDELCQAARKASDPIVEQHSLFEYAGTATGSIVDVADLILDPRDGPLITHVKGLTVSASLPDTNALAFWIEVDLAGFTVSNGLQRIPMPGDVLDWHPGYRQGVYFIPLDKVKAGVEKVEVSVNFEKDDLNFSFEL
uniref:Protein arginine N-methyltransferase n=1 Tax=Panagrellus redivivus TaxID=6233 RepID=A0A7E4VQI4_PANRE